MIIKCRSCFGKSNKIYKSKLLPEYIWPKKNRKSVRSSCQIFSCSNCYHLQLQNFTKKKIISFYGKESFVIENKKKHIIRIDKIKSFYGENFFNKKKILEIGGGINPLIINEKDYDIIDFFISKKVKKNFKNNAYKKDIDKFNIKKNYDIIILFHTLEHLLSPGKVISKLKNCLNKNGIILIEVPNFDFFIKNRPHYAVFHQHLSMFNMKNLNNLMSLFKLKLDVIFQKKEVLFCAFKNKENYIYKLKRIDNIKRINLLKDNLSKLGNLTKKFLKNKSFDMYGAGGTASLLLHNYPFLKKQILNIYDNDKKKLNKFLPLIKNKIKKNTKINFKNKSLSFYNLKKNNNFFIK